MKVSIEKTPHKLEWEAFVTDPDGPTIFLAEVVSGRLVFDPPDPPDGVRNLFELNARHHLAQNG